MAAINSLMSYLVDAGYLLGNPLGLIRQRRRKMSAEVGGPLRAVASTEEVNKIERFLDPQMWQAVTDAIEAMPKDAERGRDEYERARFIAATLYMLAPRAGELESHRMNSFREERGLWWWHVVGKGGKKAKVPVADDMLQALIRYRKYLGLTAVPRRDDTTPLLVSVKNGSPITARRLNQILKKIFNAAADLLPDDAEHKKEKLRAASAHWGRHTGITAKLDSGIDERFVQKDARHTDARTTQRYIHEEEERWHEEAQKQRLQWTGKKNRLNAFPGVRSKRAAGMSNRAKQYVLRPYTYAMVSMTHFCAIPASEGWSDGTQQQRHLRGSGADLLPAAFLG
jgi:integrase